MLHIQDLQDLIFSYFYFNGIIIISIFSAEFSATIRNGLSGVFCSTKISLNYFFVSYFVAENRYVTFNLTTENSKGFSMKIAWNKKPSLFIKILSFKKWR